MGDVFGLAVVLNAHLQNTWFLTDQDPCMKYDQMKTHARIKEAITLVKEMYKHLPGNKNVVEYICSTIDD